MNAILYAKPQLSGKRCTQRVTAWHRNQQYVVWIGMDVSALPLEKLLERKARKGEIVLNAIEL